MKEQVIILPDILWLFRGDSRDFGIATITFCCIALCFFLDVDAPLWRQNLLGLCGWTFLFLLLVGESSAVRIQVMIAVAFATVGEHFASPYMQGYIYRFVNVPAFVPPGHGMVYLTAVALGRSGFFQRFRPYIKWLILLIGYVWSWYGVTYAERGDAVGALLFCVFTLFVCFGRAPLLYLAAFIVTTYLELIGTWLGNWHWAVIDPVLGLPQGNPPSGVAAWYCLVDAVAITGAPYVQHFFDLYLSRVFSAYRQVNKVFQKN